VSRGWKTPTSNRLNDALYRAIANTTCDPIVIIDRHRVILFVNKATLKTFNYGAADLIGRDIGMLTPTYFRDEHCLATSERTCISVDREEVVGRRKDGSVFPMELSVAEVLDQGEPIFVGVLRDISARKRLEERFRRVVEAAPNAMVMINADGQIEMINGQTERDFGYPRIELLGQPAEILFPERFRVFHRELRASVFFTPQSRPIGGGRDLYAMRKDGSEFPVEIVLNPLDADGGTRVLSVIVDTTARRRVENLQAHLVAIVESSTDAIIAMDLDGVVSSWNRSAEAMFGYSATEMVGSSIKLVLPSDRQIEEDGILAMISRGERNEHFETVRRRKDGSEFPVSLTISPIFRSGDIVGASKIVRDISSRQQSEQLLRQERDAAQRYLDVADVMILVLDGNATVKLINMRGAKILGYKNTSDVIGKSWIDEFVPLRMRGTMRQMFRQLMSGEMLSVEHYINPVVSRTGEERLIAWHNSMFTDENGQIFASVSSGDDITERKRTEETLVDAERCSKEALAALIQSEEHLSRAQRLAHMGSTLRNLETRYATWSEETYRIFGVNRETWSPTAENFLGMIHPDDRMTVLTTLDPAAPPHIVGAAYDCRIIRPDGSIRTIHCENEIVRDEAGNPSFLAGTIHDVTEQRHTEDQLRQAQKMEAIGNLTGGMAHDFNNGLGVIIGNLELLGRLIKADPMATELCGEARDGALRCADLTRLLLAFARQQPLNPRQIDVNELASGTTRLLSRTLGEDITVTFHADPTLSPVAADPSQLEAALTNLANNARDAMPRGGRLDITTKSTELDARYAELHPEVIPGAYVLIEVSDTGTGIPPEIISHVFEPFFTTKVQGRGTGLGLSMVFGFVKQSGGHLAVYSESGLGTTFRIYLPHAQVSEATAVSVIVPTTVAGGDETVMLVEDNAPLRRATARQLTQLGYRVCEAEHAAAALALLAQEKQVDLLLTDVVMPGMMDGVDLAREATRLRPDLKVLLMSGFSAVRGADQSEAPCPFHLVGKPFSHDELARTVRGILDGSGAN
jgi:PAS domain S-box-containing protein